MNLTLENCWQPKFAVGDEVYLVGDRLDGYDAIVTKVYPNSRGIKYQVFLFHSNKYYEIFNEDSLTHAG